MSSTQVPEPQACPAAWLVKYFHYNEERKFITLEKVRAIEYAAQHNGTIHPLGILPFSEVKENGET